ncbi:MAG: hypothetical protein A3I66_01190 [Burkholderiales bacterium RIFCSPLOWO2_02_FULL_57_36]|nr:MAG: hypothetical protein A3I66_01190 [Burkholderiales bacterium RIFCSPLOWO2_02_FULL_57_36]
MTTITLESIKTEHNRLAEVIAAFEVQIKEKRLFSLPEAEIDLNDGEHYAGIIIGKDGASSHHLILLSGEAEEITWANAVEWAVKAGGELPTRREQALLYANLKEQFKPNWYWSCEQHAAHSDYAWCQYFDNGYQINSYKSAALRARAVRRLIIL